MIALLLNKPVWLILAFALGVVLVGFTWSELPRPVAMFTPTWTQSYLLYGQPHAIWLDRYKTVGGNLPVLRRLLSAAAHARQIPEMVIYAIPMRDLGQSSEGGFATYGEYLADNRLNADLVRQFHAATGIAPIVYLEPDSIPLAVQYRRDFQENAESRKVYADRLRVIKALRVLYQEAGAKVYLEAGHGGWFDYGEADMHRIADALNEAEIAQVDGLASNVSNRQPVLGGAEQKNEHHYLQRLLPLLHHDHLDVRVDTSRNGGPTQARQYYLHPTGALIDNETLAGRVVGRWETDAQGMMRLYPFYGPPKTLARLTEKEKYRYESSRSVLTAPAWLDAVGDVQPGPAPTDHPPLNVRGVIARYRYIKPPDDCDGALNCPPGASKHQITLDTAHRQPDAPLSLPPRVWQQKPSPP